MTDVAIRVRTYTYSKYVSYSSRTQRVSKAPCQAVYLTTDDARSAAQII